MKTFEKIRLLNQHHKGNGGSSESETKIFFGTMRNCMLNWNRLPSVVDSDFINTDNELMPNETAMSAIEDVTTTGRVNNPVILAL